MITLERRQLNFVFENFTASIVDVFTRHGINFTVEIA